MSINIITYFCSWMTTPATKLHLAGQATNIHFWGKMGVQIHKSAATLLLSGHADFYQFLTLKKHSSMTKCWFFFAKVTWSVLEVGLHHKKHHKIPHFYLEYSIFNLAFFRKKLAPSKTTVNNNKKQQQQIFTNWASWVYKNRFESCWWWWPAEFFQVYNQLRCLRL